MDGIDCATKLSVQNAQNLKAAGIDAVGRYLGQHSWKGLTVDEVSVIQDAGLAIFPIYETNPTWADYFNYIKGQSDAQAALVELAALNVPERTAVYFTVDYDAQLGDMEAICEYFRGVRNVLDDKYLVGAYGSFNVLTALEKTGHADKYYQTYAWSYGQIFHANAIYQYQNGVQIGGVQVDKDRINNSSGLWVNKDIPSPVPVSQGGGGVYVVKSGDTLSEIAAAHDTTVAALVSLNRIKDPDLIYAGQQIKLK